MFLKMHWGARPRQGERVGVALFPPNRFDTPWCGDWNNFFAGSDQQDDGGPLIKAYWEDFILRACPEIKTYFQILDAQWHEKMNRNYGQHNFMIVYPVGPRPWLKEAAGLRLSHTKLEAGPSGAPMQSDDWRIIILDPWIRLLPDAFTIQEHEPNGNPTNLQNISL